MQSGGMGLSSLHSLVFHCHCVYMVLGKHVVKMSDILLDKQSSKCILCICNCECVSFVQIFIREYIFMGWGGGFFVYSKYEH